MLDDLLHLRFVKAFSDDDGNRACGRGEKGGEGGFCRVDVVAGVDYCFVAECVSKIVLK
jgi:hypothetical protein